MNCTWQTLYVVSQIYFLCSISSDLFLVSPSSSYTRNKWCSNHLIFFIEYSDDISRFFWVSRKDWYFIYFGWIIFLNCLDIYDPSDKFIIFKSMNLKSLLINQKWHYQFFCDDLRSDMWILLTVLMLAWDLMNARFGWFS